ncbi:hypothetical protein T484DRAFT_1778885 [Baffinella frigidus]|nr:hypothetical protein T484DRAFT_1778885 [Cryptophyta sp. CCMP2293]
MAERTAHDAANVRRNGRRKTPCIDGKREAKRTAQDAWKGGAAGASNKKRKANDPIMTHTAMTVRHSLVFERLLATHRCVSCTVG